MAHFVSQFLGSVHIVVCGSEEPSKDEWHAYLQQFLAATKDGKEVEHVRTLVFSDGGGPNSAQRKSAADILKGRAIPVAIVSHNPVMRGVVTALSWFNPKVRAFAPEALGAAMKYLEIADPKRDATLGLARSMREKAKLPRLKSLDVARLPSGMEAVATE